MPVGSFDRKFGAEFFESLPGSPGVYLIYDQTDALIYVGKAINVKRRLSQYRTTLRRKKYRRMRAIANDAARIEIQCAETHLDACLKETALIQNHRPRWNIVGAFSFLYPLIGIRSANRDIEFCLTTTPDAILREHPGFEFHGAFRSRRITGDGFFALMRLLQLVGHLNPSRRGVRVPKHSHVYSFRRLPSTWLSAWASFYKGESAVAMEELVLSLADKSGARSRSAIVQEHLNELKRFWKHEVLPLAKARKATDCNDWPVPQLQRDLIFLSYRANQAGLAAIKQRDEP